MKKILIDFLIDLNNKGLINNRDLDYEKVIQDFVNKEENKKSIEEVKLILDSIKLHIRKNVSK